MTEHVVLRFGATKRPDEMEHGPDSRQVFFPLDGVERNEVSVVRLPRFTTDRLTVNPGRATTLADAADTKPVLDLTEMENV